MEKLVSIRGAITAKNTKDGIAAAAVKLVDRLYFKNGLTDGDVVNIVISVTPSLTAASAAQAVRESGHAVPLMSCAEPEVKDMVKGVIRVMITAYSDNPPRHIYLNGARALRKDIAGSYAVALDGPSGAGKSTVAKLIAARLGITYLDTGALYRALGLKCLREGVESTDAVGAENCLRDAQVTIEYENGVQKVLLDGEDVSGSIRTPEVSMAASAVSAHPYVRGKLLDIQRDIAKKSSVILDGRDIGTVVLPDAEFKFFLTASAEIRTKRRFDELTAKGQSVTYEDVYNDVVTRDRNDSTRAVAPLKQAFDAIAVNSDDMTAEDVANDIIKYILGDINEI